MLNSKKTAERSKHRRGLLRVFGFIGVVGLACAGVRVGAARAEVGNQSVVVGRQMVQLAGSSRNEIHKVSLNGQSMFFASQTSDESAEKILGRYEGLCRQNAAQSTADWKEIAANAELAKKAMSPEGEAMS